MSDTPQCKVLILVVAYNAESHIESVMNRIPAEIWDQVHYRTEVLIIDDASGDKTTEVSNLYKIDREKTHLRVLRNPVNQGYGGNQKIGFHYAIENGFDVVALLHGDGQYAPEALPRLIQPIAEGKADAVFGSRMLNPRDALKGGMPLYKFVGNRILTFVQNRFLGSRLSEFHSGYRIYGVPALKKIPFQNNSNDFDFDTDIIIQLLDRGQRIQEIPIPTFYGTEICHVNGLRYAWDIIRSTIVSRLQRFQIYYDPKFDYQPGPAPYVPKFGYASSHQFALDAVEPGATVLDPGCVPAGVIAGEFARRKGCVIVNAANAARDSSARGGRLDAVLLLDLIEHVEDPAAFLAGVRRDTAADRPRVVITAGNIAFLFLRLSLLFGQFNYSKRGILDLTNRRLFTFKSLDRLVRNAGYRIERTAGIPVPFPLLFGQNGFSRFLLGLNSGLIRLSKGLFSFQIALIATPAPTLEGLLAEAFEEGDAQTRSAERKSRLQKHEATHPA